ncbi:putative peptidase s8 s53 subtilisin kexin sedolisin protein [Neofusicoccum parvum]|nr:putative peptidase s8 s53 subtilisin kexin sedolisin protein [Neofusicoccum parvum]
MDESSLNPRKLPAKVLRQIILELADQPLDLRCLARVSRRFQSLVEPVLYSSVDISSVDQITTFVQALENRPARRDYVRTCRIQSTPGGEDTEEAKEWLSCNVYANIAALDNLQELSIASDALLESEETCCDGSPQEEQDVLEAFLFKASLAVTPPELRTWPHLTSIELHYLASSPSSFLFPGERWAFPETSFLFLSPTLRSITIHDAVLHDTSGAALLSWTDDCDNPSSPSTSTTSDPTSDRHRPTTTANAASASLNPAFLHATPLESLRLLNCSVTLRSLRTLLATPRALRHLTIGEGPASRKRGLDALSTHIPARAQEWCDAALAPQAHALETLDLPWGDLEFRGAASRLDLRGLRRLRSVRRVLAGSAMQVVVADGVVVEEAPPPRAGEVVDGGWEKILEGLVGLAAAAAAVEGRRGSGGGGGGGGGGGAGDTIVEEDEEDDSDESF